MMAFRRYFAFLATFIVLAVAISSPTAHVRAADFVLEGTLRGGESIFAPGQPAILDVILRPTSPNANVSTPLIMIAELTNLSLPDRPVIAQFATQIVPNVSLPLSLITPDKDGVYEIRLDVNKRIESRPPLLPRTIVAPTVHFSISAETRHQFVVLGSQVTPRLIGDWTLTDRRNLSPTTEYYRLNEESTRRLLPQLSNIPHLPPLPPFPRVAELPRITDLPRPAELLGRIPRPFGRQSSPEMRPEDVLNHFGGYPYFWLMDTEVGKPHLVEIDYPINVPQTLRFAVIDTSLVEKYGIFSGLVHIAATIHVAEEIVQDTRTETVATHRLLFWATTPHSLLVLFNQQPHLEAPLHNIRISRVATPGMPEDQRLPKLFEGTAQRKRIGQILGANFFSFWTDEEATKNSPAVVNDWQGNSHPVVVVDRRKAYEGTSRLLDTLHRGGYDGVTLTMLSQMSALHVLDTTDGFEIMFRRFSSEGLTLIPAIEFDMPLPSLELLLRQHPGITEEILIGNPSNADHLGRRYNVLHPAVQQAMAETVLGLVDRFGHHPSFGGVAIVLSPDTYAGLPFTRFVPDDHTFMQFRQDTERELGIPFPDAQQLRQTLPIQQYLVQKNAQRLQFLESNEVWATWVRWRAARISGFYADLAQQISARRADAPLYLLGGAMFDQPEIQQFCLPTLPRNFAPLQAIQLLGFDLPLIAQTESLHFLKPVIISTERNHAYDGLDSADTVPHFSQFGTARAGMLTGVQFVHTDTDYFVTTPAHVQSRKRFVRQLAQADVLMFMDAGVTLPFGQEHAKFDLLDTYRHLPPVPFRTFYSSADNQTSLQPLTIRTHNLPDRLMVYIVNDAPFAVEADFFFTADSRSTMSELTGHRMIRSFSVIRPASTGVSANESPQRAGSHTWRASLQPYDLLAIQISDTNAQIESVLVHRPPSIERALRQRVEELVQRVHATRGGVSLEGLVNGNFEAPVFDMVFRSDGTRVPINADTEFFTEEAIIPGWQLFGRSLTAQIDRTITSTGQNSVRLTNSSAESGTFLSEPFEIPATGRLDVSMFVGIPADAGSLPMSVVLSAVHRGQSSLEQPIHRHAPLEATLIPLLANVEPRNGVRWHRVVVPFRLPLEPLEEVRIGVQYSGSGTVWIDDVALRHVSFSENEIVELHKKLAVADRRWSSGRFSELISLLEDYWVQFLFEHVPAPAPQPVISVASVPIAAEAPPPPQSPTLYQRVRGWFGGR